MIKAYNFLMKYGNLIAMIVAVLILALFLININSGMNSMGFDSNTNLIDYKDKINFFNNTLLIAIYMIFIAAIVWILFGLYNLIMNPKGSMKFLISLIVVVVLYFVFYSTATVEQSGRLGELLSDPAYHVDANITKHISAGLKTMLSLFGLSILSLIVSEVISFFK